MGSSWKPLFSARPLEEELAAARAQAAQHFHDSGVQSLDQDEQRAFIEQHARTAVRLQTDEARLESEPVGDQLGVIVRIPFEGNAELFYHGPTGTHWTVEAQVRDGSGFYTDDPNEQPSVAFVTLFGVEVEDTDVQSWARDLTQQLTQVLDANNALIDEFNAELARSVPQWAALRVRASAIGGPIRLPG
jgi:hypothetical protein